MGGTENDRRTFARVATRLRGHARPIAEGEQPLFRGAGSGAAAGLPALHSANVPDALVEFLVALDHKIDTLLSLGSLENLRKDFPLDVEILDISGAGLRFTASGPMHTGDEFEVVVLLEGIPLHLAGAVGRVAGQDAGAWRFEFTSIRESDLEQIIQFVFREQREQIRSAKWNGSTGGK